MPVPLRRFTVAELDAFPDDGNRYELLDGVVLVTPTPGLPHQSVATRMASLLTAFLQPEADARVWAPGVIVVRPGLRLEPDVLVGRLPPGVAEWEDIRDRWLAVEVSGASSLVYDRDYKRDAYLDLRVLEVWRADLGARRVFVSQLGDAREVAHETMLTWRSPGSGRQLQIDLPDVFRDVPRQFA